LELELNMKVSRIGTRVGLQPELNIKVSRLGTRARHEDEPEWKDRAQFEDESDWN
jgi:hypothetical protein